MCERFESAAVMADTWELSYVRLPAEADAAYQSKMKILPLDGKRYELW